MKIDPQTGERLGRIIVDPDIQTRISCFLIGIKQTNAAVLTRVEFQPMARELFSLMHSQFCREIELIGLLQRITDWSRNPAVYVRAAWSNLIHLGDLQFTRFMIMPFAMDSSLYRYIALTHALYAHLRFIPLLPLDMPTSHPYVSFLHILETLHGREIQTQIAMLRNMPVALSPQERETIVGEESLRVRDMFQRFIEEIAVTG